MPKLAVGDQAPNFTLSAVSPQASTLNAASSSNPTLTSQETVTLSDLLGKTSKGVIVYFYPKASTPGCTTEACDFRDSLSRLQAQGYQVLGISPDQIAALNKFQTQQNLNFTLASDPEHKVMAAWGAWGEKKNYGKIVTGTIRSTVVVDPNGTVIWVGYNVRAKGHVARLAKELGID